MVTMTYNFNIPVISHLIGKRACACLKVMQPNSYQGVRLSSRVLKSMLQLQKYANLISIVCEQFILVGQNQTDAPDSKSDRSKVITLLC